ANLRQDGCRLLAAHDGDAGVGPGPEEAWVVGAAAHAVIARPEAAADDEGELGHLGAGDRRHELGAVLGDPAMLVLSTHHEPGDVLEEQERDTALAAELDEVHPFEGALAEEDAIVAEDAHGHAHDASEARNERRAVARLELVEARAVHDPRDHL